MTAGLIYSGVLVLSGMLIGDQFRSTRQTSWVAGLTVFLILVVPELARKRFQKVIDRQFYREKYKFDQAMRKMRVAVGSLVDRATLGRRLLEAAAEVLRLEWAAIYLADGGEPRGPLRLVACLGPTPDERVLAADNPLVERLRRTPALRVPARHGAVECLRPGDRRDDRPGGRGRQRAGDRRRRSPACSCSARSGAGCPTRTRRSPSSAPSARWPP